MYLKQAVVENNGPLRWIDVSLGFFENGCPKPLILVGGNGSGKTNLLSLIADALFEAAAVHYDDVLPSQGFGRAWFRIVGGRVTTIGTAGGFSLLRFDDAGTARFYKEKGGSVDPNAATLRLPQEFQGQVNWPTEGAFKEFSIDDDRSRLMFNEGVYTYFPSNRSEIPHWLNRDVVPETEFDVVPRFSKRLRRPIYVDRALDKFKQWMIGVITDSRADVGIGFSNGTPELQLYGNNNNSLLSTQVLSICNKIIRAIMDDNQVRFVWLGRKSPDKIAVARGQEIVLPNLDALSSGQSILLGMFGAILQYGDVSANGHALNLENLEGICLIDEVDAHIHIELQNKVLPNLMRMFPRIQFIVSSHSPIFVLGMEKEYGPDGIRVLEMPNGIPVGAETYVEFGKALEAMAATGAFTEKVVAETKKIGKPIIYVEGETDAPYLICAARVLGSGPIDLSSPI